MLTMAYDFSELKQKITDSEEWLKNEFLGIRTGRATPQLLDSIRVESYGSQLPINQVAGLTIEDARTLRIAPWDTAQVKDIEKAIIVANIGVSTATDEKGIRVIFPELTAERREQLLKLIKEKLEHVRISLRGIRDEVWAQIQQKEKDKEIGEDDKFRFKEEMEKLIKDANTQFEEVAGRKEKEIMN